MASDNSMDCATGTNADRNIRDLCTNGKNQLVLFNGNRYQCNGLSDHKEQFLCGKCAFVLTKCPLHDYILINKHQKLTGMVASVDDNDGDLYCGDAGCTYTKGKKQAVLYKGNRYECKDEGDHKLCATCAFVLNRCPLHKKDRSRDHAKLTDMVAKSVN